MNVKNVETYTNSDKIFASMSIIQEARKNSYKFYRGMCRKAKIDCNDKTIFGQNGKFFTMLKDGNHSITYDEYNTMMDAINATAEQRKDFFYSAIATIGKKNSNVITQGYQQHYADFGFCEYTDPKRPWNMKPEYFDYLCKVVEGEKPELVSATDVSPVVIDSSAKIIEKEENKEVKEMKAISTITFKQLEEITTENKSNNVNIIVSSQPSEKRKEFGQSLMMILFKHGYGLDNAAKILGISENDLIKIIDGKSEPLDSGHIYRMMITVKISKSEYVKLRNLASAARTKSEELPQYCKTYIKNSAAAQSVLLYAAENNVSDDDWDAIYDLLSSKK